MQNLETIMRKIQGDLDKITLDDKGIMSKISDMRRIVYEVLNQLDSPDLLYKRLPKIFTFSKLVGLGDNALTFTPALVKAFSKLANEKKLQVGDVLETSDNTFLVGRDGKLCMTLQDNNIIGLPAWVFEIGMQHRFSFANLENAYKKAHVDFFVYPRSMQGTHLKITPSKKFDSILIYHRRHEEKVVVTIDDEEYEELCDGYAESDVFLNIAKRTSSPKKKSSSDKSIGKGSDKSNGKSISKSNGKSIGKSIGKGSGDSKCVAQTTKKYTDRPSPPFPAADCPGLTKKGNNGKMYISVANVKGVYSWKVVKS